MSAPRHETLRLRRGMTGDGFATRPDAPIAGATELKQRDRARQLPRAFERERSARRTRRSLLRLPTTAVAQAPRHRGQQAFVAPDEALTLARRDVERWRRLGRRDAYWIDRWPRSRVCS